MNQNPKYSDKFMHEHYALMRHAAEGSAVTGEIKPESIEICKQVTRELAELVQGKQITIFHSPIRRAVKTAEIVTAEFKELGTVCEVKPLDWLRDGDHGVWNNNIATVCTDSPEHFTLFICHYRELEDFFGVGRNEDLDEAHNCTIFAKNFLISGKR